MNLKFYFASLLSFTVLIILGFQTGTRLIYNLLFSMATNPYGEEALVFIPFLVISSFGGAVVGLIAALMIIHKLSKRWGSQLNFGSHPVLKLTTLSFLTFLVLLFLLLAFYPSK